MSKLNYNINELTADGRYLISFRFIMPQLNIKNILNFRVHSVTYNNGKTQNDPLISDSLHTKIFTRADFNKEVVVDFDFNVESLRDIKNITFGFCNETVLWYRETFIIINTKEGQTHESIIQEQPSTIGNDKESPDYTKICMFSTWDIKCGISQYAKNLYNALITKNYEINIKNNETDVDAIYNLFTTSNYGILLIQYEAAIIKDVNKLINYIEKIKSFNQKIKIYFIIHSENPVLHKLDGKINGFIFHKSPRIQFSKTRCHILPMGVPVFQPNGDRGYYRKKYNIAEDKFIVSTVGFMFTWKQHADFLHKMIEYLKRHDDLMVQLLTSFHSINNKQCMAEFLKIKNIINENKLQDKVIHITEYLPQEELNERLFLSNLGFLWSGIETTSSSAALKEFVSSRLPLVKTNSNHLHDINVGCITVNKDMNIFVNKVIETYNNKEILDNLRIEMEGCYHKINYNEVIGKFMEIFNG